MNNDNWTLTNLHQARFLDLIKLRASNIYTIKKKILYISTRKKKILYTILKKLNIVNVMIWIELTNITE